MLCWIFQSPFVIIKIRVDWFLLSWPMLIINVVFWWSKLIKYLCMNCFPLSFIFKILRNVHVMYYMIEIWLESDQWKIGLVYHWQFSTYMPKMDACQTNSASNGNVNWNGIRLETTELVVVVAKCQTNLSETPKKLVFAMVISNCLDIDKTSTLFWTYVVTQHYLLCWQWGFFYVSSSLQFFIFPDNRFTIDTKFSIQ